MDIRENAIAVVGNFENSLAIAERALHYDRQDELDTFAIFATVESAQAKIDLKVRDYLETLLISSKAGLIARLFAVGLKRPFDEVKAILRNDNLFLQWEGTVVEVRRRATNDYVALVPTGTYQGHTVRKALISTSLLGAVKHAVSIVGERFGVEFHARPVNTIKYQTSSQEVSIVAEAENSASCSNAENPGQMSFAFM